MGGGIHFVRKHQKMYAGNQNFAKKILLDFLEDKYKDCAKLL